MARKTQQELAEARKARAEERRAEAEAEAKAWAQRRREERERNSKLRDGRARWQQLDVAAKGIYEELDKLNKKWPTQRVTELTVARANKVLRETQVLMKDEGDLFFEDLAEIVPAGDLPETRDVVLTLRSAMDAIARYKKTYWREWEDITDEEDEDEEEDEEEEFEDEDA
jgi:hypothetical protein